MDSRKGIELKKVRVLVCSPKKKDGQVESGKWTVEGLEMGIHRFSDGSLRNQETAIRFTASEIVKPGLYYMYLKHGSVEGNAFQTLVSVDQEIKEEKLGGKRD